MPTIINSSDGLLALPGGVFFNGGVQSGPPGDAIAIEGGAVAGATVTYINATDGSIVLTSGAVTATYTFTGVDPIDTTGSPIDDLVFNLPGNPVTTLEGDGTAGNAISQLRDTDASPGFDTTTFSPPNNSLTIMASRQTMSPSTQSTVSVPLRSSSTRTSPPSKIWGDRCARLADHGCNWHNDNQ